MNLLALDTSSIACSVALGRGEDIVERHELAPRQHTMLLMPMIEDALRQAGLQPADLDALVLGNGPGSFIGLRLGASVAQGLCYGAGLELVPVPSPAAVAAEAFCISEAECVVVAQDAHMSEVYLAAYRRGEDDLPVAHGEPALYPAGAAEPLPSGWLPGSAVCHAAGEGWRRYPGLLRRNETRLAGFVEVCWPRARYLIELGRHALRAGGAIDPRDLVPAYVRDRVTA